MSNETEILRQFKTQLISFMDELIGQFPNEGDLIFVRIFLKDQVPIQDVMNVFIVSLNTVSAEHELDVRTMVKNRDDNFFLMNNSLFQQLSKDKVNHFKRLWRSDALDTDDKDIVWKWVDSLVLLADKYQKKLAENK